MLAATVLLAAIAAAQVDTLEVIVSGPGQWASPELVEELRIGELEGRDEYVLGAVAGLSIGPEGSVFIADRQALTVRQYDSDGRWVRTIGRDGSGPGEFSRILGLRPAPGGGFGVYDPNNARVTWFDAEGGLRGTTRVEAGLFSSDVFQIDSAGRAWVRAVSSHGDSPDEEWETVWRVYSEDGELVREVGVPPEDTEGPSYVLSGLGGYFRPYTEMTLSTVSPHGYLVVGRNDRYSFSRELSDGRIARFVRPADPVPVTSDERAQWEAWSEYFEQRPGAGSFPPVPDTKPFFRHLMVDDDGRVWIAPYAPSIYQPYSDEERAERGDRPGFEWRQPLLWDVFTARGVYLGRLEVPRSTAVMAARGDVLWALTENELGVPQVVRYRITH